MVARSAYAQLRYSPLLLAGTVLGMAVTYLAAPLLVIFGGFPANAVARARLGADGARLPADLAFLSPVAALGLGFALDRCGLFGLHAGFGVPALARPGRNVEGAQPGARGEAMTVVADIESSKTEHGENFPVASLLIAPRLRAPILSFYRFARAADDIADHADAVRGRQIRGPRRAGGDAARQIGERQGGAAAEARARRAGLAPRIRSICSAPFAPT